LHVLLNFRALAALESINLPMSDATKRAEIQQYVQKAFLAKIMQMNDVRQNKKL
jgi:hypothetical protein